MKPVWKGLRFATIATATGMLSYMFITWSLLPPIWAWWQGARCVALLGFTVIWAYVTWICAELEKTKK